MQSRYYNPIWGRFINADKILSSVGSELHGCNQFVYCFNNPVVFADTSGQFPTVAIILLVIFVIGGGILGNMYEGELGAELQKPDTPTNSNPVLPNQYNETVSPVKQELPSGVTNDMLPGLSDNALSNEENFPTIRTKVKNTLIGASLGLLAGGAIVAGIGVGAALYTGYAFTSIAFLGGTAAQTTAIGILAIDAFAITIAPAFGIKMELIEGKK